MKCRWINGLGWLLLMLFANSQADDFASLMQAGFGQRLTVAQAQQVSANQALGGDWLYLNGLLQLDNGNQAAAMQLFRQYLQLPQDNVHRLKARSLFNLVRRFGQLDGFDGYYQLLRLRDSDRHQQLMLSIDRYIDNGAAPELIAKAQLLKAHSLLEVFNRPQQSLVLYQRLIEQFERGEDRYSAHMGEIYSWHRQGNLTEARVAAAAMQNSLDGGLFDSDDLASRAWQVRLDATMALLQPLRSSSNPMVWGSGSRLNLDRPSGSGANHRPLWQQPGLTNLAGQSLTLWITRLSDWRWLQPDILRMATQAGYTPMISLWYFGDEISPEYVTKHWDEYMEMIQQRLIPLLKPLPQAYLLLEPEFNKNGIENWSDWDRRMSQVIGLIKQQLPNVKVGLVLGDWDDTGQRTSYETSLNAIEQSDFIGSMLMIANYTESTHTDPDWSPWIRSLRLGQQLQQRFNKPWMLAYVAIASAPDWQRRQQVELAKLLAYLPQMQSYGLFALNWFSAVDEPHQVGWFADAETSFGLLEANYQAKPAFEYWQQLAALPPQEASLARMEVLPGRSSAEIGFALDQWSQWQLTIYKGAQQVWLQQGAGTEATLFWENFSGIGGQFDAQLQWQGQQHTESFSLLIGLLPKRNDSELSQSLAQWQQLWLTPLAGFRHVSFQLSSNQPLNDAIEIGLVDASGAIRTARIEAYSQTTETGYQVTLDTQELASGWRRYQPDTGFIWSEQPQGEVNLMLMNSGSDVIELTVSDIQLR